MNLSMLLPFFLFARLVRALFENMVAVSVDAFLRAMTF